MVLSPLTVKYKVCSVDMYIQSFHTTPEEFETQQSPVILDLCLRKPRSGKSRDHRDDIVLEKLRSKCFPYEKPAFSNSTGF